MVLPELRGAEAGTLLAYAVAITVAWLAAAYGIAWLWHRFRDKAGSQG